MSRMVPTYCCRRFLRLTHNRGCRVQASGFREADRRRNRIQSCGGAMILALVALFASSTARGQEPAPNDRLLIRATSASAISRATRVEQAPVLDGRDDDAVW